MFAILYGGNQIKEELFASSLFLWNGNAATKKTTIIPHYIGYHCIWPSKKSKKKNGNERSKKPSLDRFYVDAESYFVLVKLHTCSKYTHIIRFLYYSYW